MCNDNNDAALYSRSSESKNDRYSDQKAFFNIKIKGLMEEFMSGEAEILVRIGAACASDYLGKH